MHMLIERPLDGLCPFEGLLGLNDGHDHPGIKAKALVILANSDLAG